MSGGGGGGGPTQQTITQTNIPDWLRPQVETLLGSSMKQLFQTKETPGTYNPETGQTGPSTYEITGVEPFKPFQTSQEQLDVAKGAVAGLSPLQQQAMAGAAGLQMPGQFGVGTDLSMGAGLGGLSAGAQYAGMATDPRSMQAFMSPYMQNVVDVQQREAQRQANIAQQAQQAQFARAGAFGGGRAGIQQAQAAADLARQKQTIQATGLQNAFQQAQQAQQFGANLGLQGLSTALGAAGQLGSLGTAQLAAQRGIIDEQTKAGALEQQQEQNVINQAIQNYAQARQYPLQQFNAYNALLRGYAVPGQTATTYQAAPSLANQLGGLAGAGAAAYKMFNPTGQKEGGPVKMATGGVASLNARVLEDPYEFSPEQIKRGVKNGLISDLIGVPALSQIEKFKQQAQAMQAAQQPQQPPIAEALLAEKSQGIPALPSNLSSDGYAGGGIVAFQAGGQPPETDEESRKRREREAREEQARRDRASMLRLPAAAADIFSLPANLGLRAQDSVTNTINQVANTIGVPRLLRALGIGGPDLTQINFPRIAPSSLTPAYDLVSRYAEGTPTSTYEEYRDPNRPSTFGAPGTQASDPSRVYGGIGGPGTRSGIPGLRADSGTGGIGAGGARDAGTGISVLPNYPAAPTLRESSAPRTFEQVQATQDEILRKERERYAEMDKPIFQRIEERLQKQQEANAKNRETSAYMAAIQGFLDMAQTPGPFGAALAKGAKTAANAYAQSQADYVKAERALTDAQNSYELQKIASQKGNEQVARQAARDTGMLLRDAERAQESHDHNINTTNTSIYHTQIIAAGQQAQLRQQGLTADRTYRLMQQRYEAQVASANRFRGEARMRADANAAKELNDLLRNSPIEAAKMTPEQKAEWKKQRADELFYNYLSTQISGFREDDGTP